MTGLARVWIVPVDLPPEMVARCRDVLDDSERARAAAFLSQRDRQQYTVAHGALRILAARELQVTPSALRWDPGRYGKPELAAPWSGLSTSLSHSADLVAVAIAVGRAVGVDIQHLVPRLDVVAMSARFYPPAEAAYVATGRDASARADRFTRLWSRKEAVVKAAGRPAVAEPEDRGPRPRCRQLRRAARCASGGRRPGAGGLPGRGGAGRRRSLRHPGGGLAE